MYREPRLTVLRSLLTTLTALCAIIALPGVEAASKRALLIGIDDYKEVSDLKGCVNDVELIKSDLVSKFGFPEDNVKTLKNQDATHAGIVAGIRQHLIANAQQGDVVLLHFSGHGSQTRDEVGGDEIDGYDETLVAHDSRTPGVFDITDDQINGLMQELTAKTDHVVFWFDSCHSGAANRGGAAIRMIAADERPPPPAPDYAVSVRAAEGEADMRLRGSKYVLISGCLPHELSNEAIFEGRRHGALTWFLHEALATAAGGVTYRSVLDDAAAAVSAQFPTQNPQIEGPGQDVKLFGTETVRRKHVVRITKVDANTVELAAGITQLLGKGSILKAYAPGTMDFENASAVAIIEVTEADDFSSKARVTEGGPVSPGSKAALVKAMYTTAPIATYIDPDVLATLPDLANSLASLPALQLLRDAEKDGARLIVDSVADQVVLRTGDLASSFPAISKNDPTLAYRIEDQIRQVSHWLMVRDLKNRAGGAKVELSVRRADDPVDGVTPRRVSPGERLMPRVKNLEDYAIYPYLLDISSDGSIGLLYPTQAGAQEALPPGTSRDLKRIRVEVPKGVESVTDTFKLIATAKPIDPAVFPQGPIRALEGDQRMPTGDALTDFLALGLRGMRGSVVDEPRSWGTAERVIEIGESGLRLVGFALHTDSSKRAADLSFGTRSACTQPEDPSCFDAIQVDDKGNEWELVQRKAKRGGADPLVSVGRAFDEAYEIQDRNPGAVRVEPLLEVPMPQAEVLVPDAATEAVRGSGAKTPDPAARQDDHWSLKMIRAEDAWKMLRTERGVKNGAEAEGVLIAHIDTGYRDHPEVWAENMGRRPIDPSRGHDYYENDTDPTDPLLDSEPLDNPGHATVAGSVIVSPPGCQLEDPDGCVTGVAPGAQLIPLRVHRTVAQIDTRNMAHALRDLARGKIAGRPRIASIAMGGPPSLSLYKAAREAERGGILVIAAAGNNVGITVWPARFDSTIAVAAVNVRCRPWSGSSFGENVDISAPGEDVWRASMYQSAGSQLGSSSGSRSSGVKEKQALDIWMGEGTTYATGHTSGAAALWMAYHRDDPTFARLIEHGQLTGAFRRALTSGAWQPAKDSSRNPSGTHCDTDSWDADRYGAGILNVSALLSAPVVAEIEETGGSDRLPLFGSLYPPGTKAEKIESDYSGLFRETRKASATLDDLSRFETELMHHYTTNAEVRRSVDALVKGHRDLEPYDPIWAALAKEDLSSRLRQALGD